MASALARSAARPALQLRAGARALQRQLTGDTHGIPPCGQPLPHTHPHLFPTDFRRGTDPSQGGGVALNDLTPGIPALEYEQRRRNLMDRLPPGSAVVLMGGRIKYMSKNILYVTVSSAAANQRADPAQLQVPPRVQLLVPHRSAGARCGPPPPCVLPQCTAASSPPQKRTAASAATT